MGYAVTLGKVDCDLSPAHSQGAFVMVHVLRVGHVGVGVGPFGFHADFVLGDKLFQGFHGRASCLAGG